MNNRFRLGALTSVLAGAVALTFLAACGGKSSESTPRTPRLSASQIKGWIQAAEAGDPADKYNLGKMFRDGEGMPQDLTNAAVWFRKSAEAGYGKAQYHYGMACQEGEGVAKDLTEAAKWYASASEQGYAKAQEKLGYMCWKGEGVAKNLVLAHQWLALAAAGGEGKAAKGLKKIELSMTQQQIADAKKLAAAFTPKKLYKKPDKKSK
jgi:uncharacterized protein